MTHGAQAGFGAGAIFRERRCMILVGQYDSPFVRRVAVTMNVYAMAFERQVLSVFSHFDAMLAINPLGKVPVLQLDDGERLYDSRAILDCLDGLVPADRRMVPVDEPDRRQRVAHRGGCARADRKALRGHLRVCPPRDRKSVV